MSEEFDNVGTVRRRPRAGHQRTTTDFEPDAHDEAHTANGAAGARERNGSARNGRSHTGFDNSRRSRENRREDRDRGRGGRSEDDHDGKRSGNLPWREIAAEAPLFRCPFDPWRLFGAVKRRSSWILLTAAILTGIGLFVGAAIVPYTLSLPLIRKTANGLHGESALPNQFTPREYSDSTLYAFMKSREVIRRVVEKAKEDPRLAPLNVSGEQLAKSVSIVPLANPDFVFLKLKSFGSLPAMADLINLYGQEAVTQLQRVQRSESSTINAYLQNQLTNAEKRITEIKLELRKLSDSGIVSFDKETEDALSELRKTQERLESAKLQYESIDEQIKSLDREAPDTRLAEKRRELNELLLTRTDKHPDVIQKRREIAALEKQQSSGEVMRGASSGSGNDPMSMRRMDLATSKPMLKREIDELSARLSKITNNLGSRSDKDMSYAIKSAELESRQKARDELLKSAREAQLYAEASLGYYGIPEEATDKSIDKKNRWIKVSAVALLFGLLGAFVTAGIALIGEALDTTLKTSEDIMRVCRLPVLASLGDLRKMSAKQQADWAFRTLTLLKGKLSRNPDEALVCGIISANHGEGRSTWVNLLVNAASQRGLRVLTVDTRPAAAAPASTAPNPRPEKAPEPAASTPDGAKGRSIKLPDEPELPAMAQEPHPANPLSTPEKVTEKFDGPSPQALVHIPLPGWVWSLERRKQWQDALDQWKQKDNLVIFVELPPACESESVLLAENLPQVIWLVGSGMADAAETSSHLETLRHAHCNLVGAVLNHAPPPFLNSKIGRWLNPVTALAFLVGSLACSTLAAEAPAVPRSELQTATTPSPDARPRTPDTLPPNGEKTAFSANAKRQRAQWQEHLTFGPGDVVDIHFYGNAALTRTNVFIGPDGRINYLQANGVKAAGLSVEELRQKLDQELATYYPSARTIVLPVSFNSKKYFMLGKVNTKGSFSLDRPLTLIEAVARARGLETGLYQRTTVELADLGHSFIVRSGARLPVNFEKLFLEGDLSQNVPIEPNDYIYFASTGAQDIYVVGEVMNPGPLGFVSSATVLSAITDRGGFSDRAFKRRVLVVRGSLNEPETFVVNTDSALDGHLRDFRLQPRDIVYVSRRPWVRAEELADEAAQSFIQGAITTWSGVNIGPVITGRILPRL